MRKRNKEIIKKTVWDKMARSFHFVSSDSRSHREKYTKIAKMALSYNPRNILDLGCGSGLLEAEILKNNFLGGIYAVDASSEMLKIASSVHGDRVNFIKMDLNNLNINKKFDVIIIVNVLFFINDKKKFLISVRRLLSDQKAKIILVNPKPNKETNSVKFINAHLSGLNLMQKICVILKMFKRLPKYFNMLWGQFKIYIMSKRGIIQYDSLIEIKKIAKLSKLRIIHMEDIQANQNRLFIMEHIR